MSTANNGSACVTLSGRGNNCFRCDSPLHLANDKACPTRNKECQKCGKVGHFKKVCISHKSSVRLVELLDHVSVLQVEAKDVQRDPVYGSVLVQGMSLPILVDTVSAVSLMDYATYNLNFSSIPLTRPRLCLVNCTQQEIAVKGCFTASVIFEGRSSYVLFHVVERGKTMFGRDAVQKLDMDIVGGILSCFSVEEKGNGALPEDLMGQFRHLFREELGVAKKFVHRVRIRSEMEPVAAKLRRLPLPLRGDVTKELVRMEAAGIFKKLDASLWVSPVVVVARGTTRYVYVSICAHQTRL